MDRKKGLNIYIYAQIEKGRERKREGYESHRTSGG